MINGKVLIDANVILRYMLSDIKEQADQAEIVIRNGAYTTPEVLAEVIYVLRKVYKIEKKEVCDFVAIFLNEIDIENKACMYEALNIHAERALDFVDCLLIAYNNLLKVKVFSFDEKLMNALS